MKLASPFRILVTGSRNFPLPLLVGAALTQLTAPYLTAGHEVVIVHGACPHPTFGWSVDTLAHEWVDLLASPLVTAEPYPAEWDRYGRGAGPKRNAMMVALGADVCLAFIANGSRGSTGCAAMAERARIPILRFRVDGPVSLLVPEPGTVDPHPEGGPHGQ